MHATRPTISSYISVNNVFLSLFHISLLFSVDTNPVEILKN